MKKVLLIISCLSILPQAQSQDIDQIISTYIENIGGSEALLKLEGIKISAKVNQQGMEIPLEIVQLSDGRQYTKVSVQGMTIMQGVYDGTTVWNTNFQTMKPEKADAETTENLKRSVVGSFPDPLLNYKDKGFKVESLGKETFDGTEVFKVKLTQKPLLVDGVEIENISYYYFDSENYVPIVIEKEIVFGPQKGIVSQVTLSDYQEVGGLYFAFSLSQGVKDGPSQAINIDTIEINPTIDESIIKFPEGN